MIDFVQNSEEARNLVLLRCSLCKANKTFDKFRFLSSFFLFTFLTAVLKY